MARFRVVNSYTTGWVGPARIIETEEIERVVLPQAAGPQVHPLILDTACVPSPTLTHVEAVEGCRIDDVRDFEEVAAKLILFRPTRRLRPGELWPYAVRVRYRLDELGLDYAQNAPATRESAIGLHRRADLCMIRIHFRLDDRPARCTRFYQRLMRGEQTTGGDAPIDPTGLAHHTVTQPRAGWHGLVWDW